jgi:hypothetical protein
MHKKKMIALAIMGIGLGVLAIGHAQAQDEKMSSEMKSFYEQLSPDAKKKFLQLDSDHRDAAMQVMQEKSCKGESQCKGTREKAVQEQYEDQFNIQPEQRQKASEKLSS